MLGKVIIYFLVLNLVCAFSSSSFAQSNLDTAEKAQSEKSSMTMGPRKQMAAIIFAGLGGAVLGLSTLSFYGRPQDKLANIAIGFALGVITGTVLVTYRAATTPQEMYGSTFDELQYKDLQPLDMELKEPVQMLSLQWTF